MLARRCRRRRLGISSYVLRRSLMGVVVSGERAEEKVGCEGRKEGRKEAEGRRCILSFKRNSSFALRISAVCGAGCAFPAVLTRTRRRARIPGDAG